jgi:hypothetical protein
VTPQDAAALTARWPRAVAQRSPLRWPPAAVFSISVQAVVFAACVVLFPVLGLSVAWRTALPNALLLALLLGTWTFYATSKRANRAIVCDTLLATFLVVLFTNVAGAAQYGAVALNLPLADSWLAAADAALGIHVPALTEWTGQHRVLAIALVFAYFSLLPQFVLPLIGLGLWYRNRQRLWEYVFHFHFCLAVTLVGVAVFPAACAFAYYGFESLIDQARFTSHFEGLRDGTLRQIRFDNIEGLISFPSFHTAGGLMVTWVFRGYRWWSIPLAVLNALLITATVLTGAHYGIDLLVTILMFAGSVLLWRRWIGAPAQSPVR